MRLVAVTLVYFVCLCQTDDRSAPLRTFGEVGHSVTLPCHDKTGNVTPAFTQWLKDGSIVARRNHSSQQSPTLRHFIISNIGSLDIAGLLTIDEGIYECQCTPRNTSNVHNHTVIHLQIFSGPNNVTLDISPAEKLPNGTLYVRNGTDVHFKCSTPSTSYPSRTLSWILGSEKVPLASSNGSLIQFEFLRITPVYQGNHSCLAENTLSKKKVTSSKQLLVYFPPERHPECNWRIQNYSSLAVFICSWRGGYPAPTLQWEDVTPQGAVLAVFGSAVNETLEVMLNRSMLRDGQNLNCRGKHIATSKELSCQLNLKIPFPEGEPLVVAVEGTNVTLTCTDATSAPPATTIWQRTVARKDIEHGSKYVLSRQGPIFSLTIVNLTKDDEGTYFCRSENPIAARELEIYLTVKSSVSYTGGIVGTFLSVIILGAGIAIGMAAYNNRHKICLDDEEIFQDAVPRLPVLPNGHATTLVEIHRIPSSDHEEQDNTVGSQENQDTRHFSVVHEEKYQLTQNYEQQDDAMRNLSPPACPLDNGTKGASDGLVEQLRPIHPERLRGTAGCETWSVAFSPGGTFFAWSMGYGVVKVLSWPLPGGEEAGEGRDAEQTDKAPETTLNCGHTVWGLAFGPRPKTHPGAISHATDKLDEDAQRLLLATGLNNGIIKIWRVSNGEAMFNLEGHQSVVRELVFTPNGTLTLVSGSRDGTLRIWDLTTTGKACHTLLCRRGWVVCCRVSPDSSMIASVCNSDNRVCLWSLRSYTSMKDLAVHKQRTVSSCDFSPDGAVLAVGSSGPLTSAGWRVDLWDPYTAELLVTLEECCSCEAFMTSKTVKTLCFSPDGLSLALVVDHRALRLWELGQNTFVMETDFTRFHNELCCTFHPQGGIIATGTRDGYARFWKVKPTVLSLGHLCRAVLRCSVSTHQIRALPIPQKLLEFLTYRDIPKSQETYCRAHRR
ncbi:hypothetical protein ACEWY4_012315 [Coilia grayii]|uniref:Uncharacterized protein n=1 Tax=Coilia grayii TaxID=363190 RepID=A0ABD1K066_9TELE